MFYLLIRCYVDFSFCFPTEYLVLVLYAIVYTYNEHEL